MTNARFPLSARPVAVGRLAAGRSEICWLAAGLLLGVGLVGCNRGDTGPKRYHVKGTVIYDGEPLKRGRITFVPDAARGTTGPAGYAVIQSGSYDTSGPAGKGTVAGAIKVMITGQDLPPPEGEEMRPDLFTDEVFELTIAPDAKIVTHDFTVEPRKKRQK